ncbi:hypothetical protein LMG28138_05324 [Pararobbsia alpina]|uniref:Autotransporter domain-containing protein n=2 Tax=Pararobbsia alpina TaxID=621374 RepID=A0A6S7BYN3_9BURK|nr:hypothetical protein LMG28138_05324 [Pararobbsia alpina]
MPATQLTQNGAIGGTGALTKIGTGTLTLAGQNTYTGGTSLDGGVVQVSADANLGAATGPLSFNGGTLRTTADITMSRATTLDTGGGTIDTIPGTQLTQNGAIDGTGALTKAGTGTLTLAGQNTYTGGTSLDGGMVQIGADANLGAATGPLSFNGGTLRTTDDITMSRATTLDIGGGTIDTMPATQLTQNGAIGGTGALTKIGTGTLTLAGQSTYTGGTSLDGGVVQVSADANLGAATGPLSFNGGTLRTTADMTMSRATTLDTGGGTIDTMPATQLTQNGTIGGTGALTKAGTGTLVLSAANVYAGGTSLNGGVVQVSSDANLGAATGPLSFNGGTLRTTTDITMSRATTLDIGGGTVDTMPGTQLTQNGAIGGTGALTKIGTGALTLAGQSTYTGGTSLDGGVVQVSADANLGAATGPLNFNGGTLRTTADITMSRATTLDTSGGIIETMPGTQLTQNGTIGGAGALTKIGTGTLTLAGQSTYAGGTSLDGGVVQVSADANLGAATGTLSFNGGTLRTTADMTMSRATTLDAGGGTIETMPGTQLTQNGTIGGTGALTKAGTGTLVLSAANVYSGSTTVSAGTLSAGANDTFSANSGHTVASGATLNLAGHNQTIRSLSNAGTVTLGGAPGTVLRVSGDYTGSGGMLAINTTLNGDASPTNRLIVDGNTAGATKVTVVNLGGAGAPTSEGIKIVDVGGISNGNFTLQSDYTFRNQPAVVAGAYAYALEKNGVSTLDDGDWYLRSNLNSMVSGIPTIGIGSVPNVPVFQAGVPVYEAYPQILQALNELPTLRQRVGDRYTDKADLNFVQSPSGTQSLVGDDTPVWVRVIGKHGNFSPASTTSSTDYDLNATGLQAGFDGKLYRDGNGSLVGGFTTHYESSAAHVSSIFGNGRIDASGFGFGGTLTWYGQDGFYADGQGQVTWFDSDLSSNLVNGDLKDGNHGLGYAFSMETGKRVRYTDQWTITPQAQLTYSAVDFDSFTDPFDARVSLDQGNSLRGRLGVSIDYRDGWRDNAGKLNQLSFYAIPNFYYEFLDGTSVDVSGSGVGSRNERLWTGLGLGSKCSWADGKYSVYGEVSANTSVNHFADSYTVKVDAGLRIAF